MLELLYDLQLIFSTGYLKIDYLTTMRRIFSPKRREIKGFVLDFGTVRLNFLSRIGHIKPISSHLAAGFIAKQGNIDLRLIKRSSASIWTPIASPLHVQDVSMAVY